MINEMLNLNVEIKLEAVKKASTSKNMEIKAMIRKPDLCYDLEHVLDRISTTVNSKI
ncbi:MAG: hypothetical protein WCK67_00100 [bacterium]